MPSRVTRVFAEVLVGGTEPVRITRTFAEVLTSITEPVRITRIFGEILTSGASAVRITRLFSEILAETGEEGMVNPDCSLQDEDIPFLPPGVGQISMQLVRDGLIFDLLASLDTAFAFIETRDLDLGEPALFKFIQRVFLEIRNREGAPGLFLIVKYRNTLIEPLQEMPEQSLDTDEPITLRVPGAKYHRYRIEDRSVRVPWQLAMFELWGEMGGGRV